MTYGLTQDLRIPDIAEDTGEVVTQSTVQIWACACGREEKLGGGGERRQKGGNERVNYLKSP